MENSLKFEKVFCLVSRGLVSCKSFDGYKKVEQVKQLYFVFIADHSLIYTVPFEWLVVSTWNKTKLITSWGHVWSWAELGKYQFYIIDFFSVWTQWILSKIFYFISKCLFCFSSFNFWWLLKLMIKTFFRSLLSLMELIF